MKKIKTSITIVLFYLVLAGLAISTIVIPDAGVSYKERRKLRSFPVLSLKTISSGSFQNQLEEYLQDHIAFRDGFLDLNSLMNQYFYLHSDDEGIVVQNGSLIALEEDLDEKSAAYAITRINSIYDRYLKNTECSLYFSIIPDKAYFLEEDKFPKMEYDKLEKMMENGLPEFSYINLVNQLSLDQYYYSDSHWNQVEILQTARYIASQMGTDLNEEFEIRNALNSFQGVYGVQSLLEAGQDRLQYVWTDCMENMTVKIYTDPEKYEESTLYNFEMLESLDPYSFFLSGNPGLAVIENPQGNGKELILFRDSFGSSIAPVLAAAYSRVVLVDIRNINSSTLESFINFDHQDVLFLYSSSVLNNAYSFK